MATAKTTPASIFGAPFDDFLPLKSLRLRNDSQYLLTSGFDVGETVASGAHAGNKITAIFVTPIGFLICLANGLQLVETGPGSGVVA